MNLIAIRPPPEEIVPHNEEEQGESLFSLKWLVAFLVRRWKLIAATALLVSVVCFTAFLFEQPKYTATALMMIDPGKQNVLGEQQRLDRQGNVPTTAIVDSQLDVLRSPMMMGRLVEALGLNNDPEWNSNLPRERASSLDLVRAAAAESGPSRRAAPRDRAQEQVIGRVSASFDIRRRATSNAVEVAATSANPERAAQMANRLVELFVAYQVERGVGAMEQANVWLSARLRELTEEVQQKQAAVEAYRAETGIWSTPQAGDLVDQQMTDIEQSVTQARVDLAAKQARYDQVRRAMDSGGSLDAIAGVIDSDAIAQLRAREADIRRRQADVESRYGDMHPTVQNVRAERGDIENQIRAELARIVARLRNDTEVARASLAALQQSRAGVRGERAGDNEARVRLMQLEREAKVAGDVLDAFRQQYMLLARQGDLTMNASMVSPATVPSSRTTPNLKIAFLLSLGLGLALGLAAGFLAETLDEGFRTSEEIERKTGVAALANVPRLRRSDLRSLPPNSQHPAGYLVERQMSAFTEALRVLRTTILFGAGQPKKTQVVAVSSALPDEGKTTVSLCLARVSALSGQKVLLIDCDLRRRTLKDVLGLEPPLGLLQVLSGEANWRKAIYVDEASGMHLLPLKDSGFTPKDVFGNDAMTHLVDELRGMFDLIILDCAPVLAVAETRVIVARADSTVLVARWEKTPIRAVRSALQQLQSAGANVIGIALNYIDMRVPGYAYRMKGYYTTS
jgi:exopolysaccharide transport family protein